MRRRALILALVGGGIGLAAWGSAQRPRLPAATSQLQNPGFEDVADGLPGWARQGDPSGQAGIVREPVASGCRALELTVGPSGSRGPMAMQVFQILDTASYVGRRVRFGARIRTKGAAVNITLFTPQGLANDFFQELHSGVFVERSQTFNVPRNATMVSFGIQVMGPAGGQAYVDDTFVVEDGPGAARSVDAPKSAQDCSGSTSASTDPVAEVRLGSRTAGRALSPHIFGLHLEWVESGQGLVDSRGRLRQPVVAALSELRPPLFRFPGGIHADYYDWRAGVGEVSRRPRAENVFSGRTEAHIFGSPEFVSLLRSTGAEALITANYGTGTPDQAGAWAEYFRQAGVKTPYWEVGNEIYLADPSRQQPNGKRIARTAEEYARDFPRYARAIKGALPEAQVGLIGHLDDGAFPLAPPSRRTWTQQVIKTLTGGADFLSVHNAYAPVVIDDAVKFDSAEARARVYKAMFAGSSQTAANLAAMATLLDQSAATKGLPIAVTEWGPLFGYSGRRDVTAVYADQSRTMAAAVYTASILDVFLADARVVLATYTNPIHKWYGSLLTDTDMGLVRTPSYYLMGLYRTRFADRLVPTTVTTRRFAADRVGLINARSDIPEILARAAASADGRRVTIMLVNRNLEETVATKVAFGDWMPTRTDCLVLAASAPNAVNGPRLTDTTSGVGAEEIRPRPLRCDVGRETVISLPPAGIVSLVAER